MTTPRRLSMSCLVLSLVALAAPAIVGAAAPSSSGIVVRFDDIALPVYVDEADHLVAVAGPPIELGCNGLGFEDFFTPVQAAITPSNAVVVRVHASEVPIWIYAAGSIDEACETVAGGGSPELVASGDVRFTHTDNDFLVSETRMNAFGDTATGPVEGPDGSRWTFTGTFRALVEGVVDGECVCRIVRQDISLTPRDG
jgi:hypothetical protein